MNTSIMIKQGDSTRKIVDYLRFSDGTACPNLATASVFLQWSVDGAVVAIKPAVVEDAATAEVSYQLLSADVDVIPRLGIARCEWLVIFADLTELRFQTQGFMFIEFQRALA
jgi:hypothetical protein